MVYVSAKDWHGWDKIHVTVADFGNNLEATAESKVYYLYLSVAAVNDAPTIEVIGFDTTHILDLESLSGGETASVFHASTPEDTVRVITGVAISDVDTDAGNFSQSRPTGFFGTIDASGKGNGVGLLALHPEIELYISCTYGLLTLSGGHGGLVIEEGDLGAGGQSLTVIGTISAINSALIEGIIYTPEDDWSGIDLLEVRSNRH